MQNPYLLVPRLLKEPQGLGCGIRLVGKRSRDHDIQIIPAPDEVACEGPPDRTGTVGNFHLLREFRELRKSGV